MKFSNEILDDFIIDLLRRKGPLTFVSIVGGVGYSNQSTPEYRQVDRRLQALKRDGKVTFARPAGWNLPGQLGSDT